MVDDSGLGMEGVIGFWIYFEGSLIRFVDRLDMRYKRKRKIVVKDDIKFFW